MKLLDRYIGINVVGSIGLVLLVLISLDSFFRLVRELNQVGEGNYSYIEMLLYLVLTTPYRIVEFFPIATLLGAITGLGMLASHSELVVMRAAGVSILRITLSVMKAGLLLIIAVMLLAEYVVPTAEQFAESRRTQMLAKQTALKTDNGFWSRDKRSFLNIRDIRPTGDIGNITIYEFDEQHRLRSSTHANKALYENGQWVLYGITQSDIDVSGVKTQTFERAQWDSILSPALLNIVVIDPLQISIRDLYSYSSYLRENGQNAERYELALWARLFMPVAIAVMLLLAVPFVFGPLRSVSIGQRILVGFLVGLAFFLVNQAFNHLGVVYHIPPLLSASLPAGVFLLLALLMLRRV
ncbi:LPS export ABC transporter permease LptG [Sulfuriflexus mobilis]|uniref:LPS export ABC transporter permease LptG n=1 Tax=Sulfuriflexus mobilis TaxID=1811807 RepID=UPI001559050A|nr:LPS export ABC transporter permease LptG [Sulfuriflexus mobilis]